MQSLNDNTRPPGSPEEPPAELVLRNCIEEQSSVFDNAVQLIETLENAASRRHGGDPESVSQLQRTLERVVTAQQKVSKAHARFTALKVTSSAALKSSLTRHEETLKKLVSRINSLQHVFESIRNELSPELDSDLKRRSMHAAYQKSLKSI